MPFPGISLLQWESGFSLQTGVLPAGSNKEAKKERGKWNIISGFL